MIDLIAIRHAPTAWNEARRIQGHTDVALSAAGQAAARCWHLPSRWADFAWVSSPLRRCRDTAALLGQPDVAVEAGLIEMHWGAWEGQTLAALRTTFGPAFKANEARGLDFRPTGGESPRDVQQRLRPWLGAVASAARPTIAVTHKGVIRALYALASGWDMVAAPRDILAWDRGHGFHVKADGSARVARLNIPLAAPLER